MTTLNQTLECLIEGIGAQTGEAIRTEINNLLGMPNVDLQALQSAIAASSVAALQTAVDAIDSRETERHNGHGNRLNGLEDFRSGIEAIDCTALLAKHALGLSAGLTAPAV